MKIKKPILNVIQMDELWDQEGISWEERISESLEKASEILNKDFSCVEVNIVLSNNETVQNLNKTYRHKDSPTNVLSFDSSIEGELGDIILAYETVMKEAEAADLSFLHHTLHLIIHGFLHLLGYEHEEESEAETMEAMEIRILKALNIKNPYEVL